MALLKLKVVCRWAINMVRLPIAFCLIFYGCRGNEDTLPFYNTADFTAEWIKPNDPKYTSIHTIANFNLYSQLGYVINKDTLAGHVYLANFFFSTCPSICPLMMGNLNRVQQAFLNNSSVKLVSFSVMPWRDSVESLRAYGKVHGIDPRKWYLLTGNKNDIYQLSRQSYFSEKRLGLTKANDDFLHTESLLLIDKQSRIRGIYAATDTAQVRRAIDDIKILLKEG